MRRTRDMLPRRDGASPSAADQESFKGSASEYTLFVNSYIYLLILNKSLGKHLNSLTARRQQPSSLLAEAPTRCGGAQGVSVATHGGRREGVSDPAAHDTVRRNAAPTIIILPPSRRLHPASPNSASASASTGSLRDSTPSSTPAHRRHADPRPPHFHSASTVSSSLLFAPATRRPLIHYRQDSKPIEASNQNLSLAPPLRPLALRPSCPGSSHGDGSCALSTANTSTDAS